jgi:ferredoxin
MKTDLFYYTGSGNSLWAARILAEKLGDVGMVPISRIDGKPRDEGAEAVGIIFPVHIWGLPRRVISFVDALANDLSRYYFAVAVNAGQVAATLLQLKKLMQSRGLPLSAGFGIEMPSNYIPWGGPGPEEKRRRRIDAAREKLGVIAAAVAARKRAPVERGPLWQNILFTGLNRLAFPHVPGMDKSFWVDEKCNACGVCKTICPCGNIDIEADGPVWRHRCEQCFACLQWCPQEAIQHGKKTPGYERYHHPEVTLQDILAAPGAKTGMSRREET